MRECLLDFPLTCTPRLNAHLFPHPRTNFKSIFYNQCLADLFHSRSEYSLLPMETKSINLCYLNRAGRLDLRPERNGNEISRRDVLRVRTTYVIESASANTLSKSCTSWVSNPFLEWIKFVALRLWEEIVRDLSIDLSDSSTSISLFLDLIISFIVLPAAYVASAT